MTHNCRDWLRANGSKYRERDPMIRDCQKATGIPRKSIRNAVQVMFPRLPGLPRGGLAVKINALRSSGKQIGVSQSMALLAGIPVSQLRAMHDPIFKVRKACQYLKKHKDHVYPEAEFRQRFVQLDSSKFRDVVDKPEFEEYKGKAGAKVYWGHPSTISKFKDEGWMYEG